MNNFFIYIILGLTLLSVPYFILRARKNGMQAKIANDVQDPFKRWAMMVNDMYLQDPNKMLTHSDAYERDRGSLQEDLKEVWWIQDYTAFQAWLEPVTANTSALDLSRKFIVLPLGIGVGYISAEQAWDYLRTAANEIRQRYHSWEEFHNAIVEAFKINDVDRENPLERAQEYEQWFQVSKQFIEEKVPFNIKF